MGFANRGKPKELVRCPRYLCCLGSKLIGKDFLANQDFVKMATKANYLEASLRGIRKKKNSKVSRQATEHLNLDYRVKDTLALINKARK